MGDSPHHGEPHCRHRRPAVRLGYTVLKRLIGKGVLERSGTDFTVTPLVTRRQMQLVELNNLVEKRFGGSEAEMLEVLCRDGCPDPAHRQALVQVLEELR